MQDVGAQRAEQSAQAVKIYGVDPAIWRHFRAQAILAGLSPGEAFNAAARAWIEQRGGRVD